MPTHWATKDLENINFDKIRYYLSQGQKPKAHRGTRCPDDIKKTFERLGIRSRSASSSPGVEAQFDSEAAYSNIKESFRSRASYSSTPPRASRASGDLPQVVRQGDSDR
jgi:Fe-S cluster assembly protein SufB